MMELDSRSIAQKFIDFSIKMKKLVRGIAQNAQGCALTDQQFRTLMCLRQMGRAGLKELSGRIMVSPSSLCIMFNKLYDQGIVNRECDEEDRRNTIYSISENGSRLLEEEARIRINFLSASIDRLDESEKSKLLECIEEGMKILEKMSIK